MGYIYALAVGGMAGILLVFLVMDSPRKAVCFEACAREGFPLGELRWVEDADQCWCFKGTEAKQITPLTYGWTK